MLQQGKFFAALLLIVFPTILLAQKDQDSSIVVEVEAIGQNAAEAMINAKRAAVEKGIGTYIQSETEIKNFMLNKDVILTRTEGAVKSVTTLSETTGPDGAVTVKVRATVSASQIRDDLRALRILLESMEKPRVMVLIKESNIEESEVVSSVAETEILKYLSEKEFNLVDPAAVEQLRSEEEAIAAMEGNAAAAAVIGAKAGADMIIAGTAVSRVAESIGVDLGGMKSCQADVSVRVIVCATASIIAAKNEHAAAVHVSPQSGGARAIGAAAKKVMDHYLLDKIISSWQDAINNGIPLRVTVSDVKTFGSAKTIVNNLQAMRPAVVKVTQRDWNGGTGLLELEVLYKGNAGGFCETIEGTSFHDGSMLSVTAMSANSIRLGLVMP